MAYVKYAGEEAVGRIADYVNKKLTFASSMPESPEANTIVLYVGSTSASYLQGGIYKFDGTDWILINSVQTIELTQAEYDALPSATKLNGTIYFITDAGGDPSGTDIVQGYLNPADGKFYEESTYETEITPNVDILYIDLSTNRIFRYDSTEEAYIAISGGGGGSYTAGFGIDITNDTIKTTDFIGTQDEWDSLTASEKAKFDIINITDDQTAQILQPGHAVVDSEGVEKTQREKLKFEGFSVTDDSTNELTKVAEIPYTAGDGIDITSKEVSVTSDRPATFVGTTQEWDALTAAEKAQYKVVNLTNDTVGGDMVVVDSLQDGNLNPVTSNAVYDAVEEINSKLSNHIIGTRISITINLDQAPGEYIEDVSGLFPSITGYRITDFFGTANSARCAYLSCLNYGQYVLYKIRTQVSGTTADLRLTPVYEKI